MTIQEKNQLAAHAGHEIEIVDYMPGDDIQEDDHEAGRFCLECTDCNEILLGARTKVA